MPLHVLADHNRKLASKGKDIGLFWIFPNFHSTFSLAPLSVSHLVSSPVHTFYSSIASTSLISSISTLISSAPASSSSLLSSLPTNRLIHVCHPRPLQSFSFYRYKNNPFKASLQLQQHYHHKKRTLINMLNPDAADSGDEKDEDVLDTEAQQAPALLAAKEAALELKRLNAGAAIQGRVSSVVKLFVRKAPVSYTSPWRKDPQTASTGTGFLLPNRMILTNAHVIHRATVVLARGQTGDPIKVPAKILSASLPFDLALLTVEDDAFWLGKEPLRLSEILPQLDENVTAVGFPLGGDNVSITRGVVSRVDVDRNGVLRIQIDAAINPGNSGGPVFNENGEVVGVASSTIRKASNIGYVIPSQVVQMFLNTVNDVGGISSIGIGQVQALENPTLRTYLGLPHSPPTGIRISSIEPLGPAKQVLEPNDVLLSINDVPIAQNGTVPLRPNERIHFLYLITQHPLNTKIKVTVLRNAGKDLLDFTITTAASKLLVPRIDGYDVSNPSYLIIGGLVFVPLTYPWYNEKKKPPIMSSYEGYLEKEGQQIVVLSKVLAHELNLGYHGMSSMILTKLNGNLIHNLKDFAQQLEQIQSDDTLRFELSRSHDCDGPEWVCLSKKQCIETEAEILEQHLISRRSSADLNFTL